MLFKHPNEFSQFASRLAEQTVSMTQSLTSYAPASFVNGPVVWKGRRSNKSYKVDLRIELPHGDTASPSYMVELTVTSRHLCPVAKKTKLSSHGVHAGELLQPGTPPMSNYVDI